MTARRSFQTLNCPSSLAQSSPDNTSFTLSTPVHATDIWRKPPSLDVFNAPMIYKSIPLSSFKHCAVTVSAPWTKLYDQGGLVFAFPSGSGTGLGHQKQVKKWIKTGIELYKGEVFAGTVAADNWADWSLVSNEGSKELRVQMEKNEQEGTLWIYVVGKGKKVPIREVTWALQEKGDEVWVGVYAARPTVSEKGTEEQPLVVQFEDFELKTTD